MHAEGLRDALQREGHAAEIVAIPFKWYPPERLLDVMLACRLLDLSEFHGNRTDVLIGLKFPAYYIPHPRKVLWILHQHRAAYDLWGHEFENLHHFPNGDQIRSAITRADCQLIPEARGVFTNSQNVAARLRLYCGIESQPLYHPPPHAEQFYCSSVTGDYLFFPSRINRAKRQDLVLKALACTRSPVRIRFSGLADEEVYPRELEALSQELGVQKRVEWLGYVSQEEKVELCAHAVGILYPPLNEDYGYVSLEAMLSSKPLITCTDSGGPLELVQPDVTGLVAEPSPQALASAMDLLWQDRTHAQQMGQAGRNLYASLNISWKHVTDQLLSCF